MGNTTPNLEKTLRFTEVNFPEVHRYKRKSQTKKLQSWLKACALSWVLKDTQTELMEVEERVLGKLVSRALKNSLQKA